MPAIWSCNVLVPVLTTTLRPDSSAGTRYARVLPVPVPASTSRRSSPSIASAIRSAIASWPGRAS